MPRKGQKLTAEQRQKISESRKHLTPEQRENIAAAQRGKTIPPETRAKMSAKHMGHPVSPEARAAIGNAHRGKFVSEESREKNRQAHLGNVASELTRRKMSAAHVGNAITEDSRQKISNSLVGKPKTELHCQNISDGKKGTIPANIEILKQSRIGAVNSDYQKERSRQAITGLVRSEETKRKVSENRTGLYCGAENHAWNGGSSFFPYCPKFNERRKRAVRNFFGDLCLTCCKPAAKNLRGEKAVALSVHHVHHNKTEGCHGIPFNLVPLCHDCHNEEQFEQGGYKLRINKILDEGFASGHWSREQYEREVMYPEESNET